MLNLYYLSMQFSNSLHCIFVYFAAFNHTARPINWTVNVWELDPDDESNNGFENEDLIVWMRTAALPTFRKLYRRVDHNTNLFRQGIPDGMYSLRITYRIL